MSLLAVALATTIVGSVQEQRPCPPSCSTTISVRMEPFAQVRGQPGRYFLAVFPVENGEPNMAAGGYWDGSTWRVSAVPASFRQGQLAGAQESVRIEGGLCALAAASGAAAGSTFAILGGYGRDVMALRAAEVEAMAGEVVGDSQEAIEARETIMRFRSMQSEQMSDFAAAKAMREDGSLREIGRVRCG